MSLDRSFQTVARETARPDGGAAESAPLRAAVARSHWLLVRGTGERPLDAVHGDRVAGHSSTRRPSVQRGDAAVLYASRWQVIYGLAEVVGDPENDPARDRWRWRFALRPVLVVDDLREAPPVEAAAVMPSSLGRHSYVRLTPAQFDAARDAIRDAARPRR